MLDSRAEGPGFKSQPRRCRVTVLGKLFTPVVPLFTKQQNWQQPIWSMSIEYGLPFPFYSSAACPTHRHTDHATCDIHSKSPHLCALRPSSLLHSWCRRLSMPLRNYHVALPRLEQASLCVSYLRTLTTWHCPHSPAAAAAIGPYLPLAGPTAANMQQRVCCCGPMLGQTDGHRTVPPCKCASGSRLTVDWRC